MPKIMDSMLPILSVFLCWATILGTFGGPPECTECCDHPFAESVCRSL